MKLLPWILMILLHSVVNSSQLKVIKIQLLISLDLLIISYVVMIHVILLNKHYLKLELILEVLFPYRILLSNFMMHIRVSIMMSIIISNLYLH